MNKFHTKKWQLAAPQVKFKHLRLRLEAAGFAGDILDDAGSRIAVSTDNSVYQIVPSMVLAPMDEDDVCRALAVLGEERFADIALTVRGGGTGTNGQSLGEGVILDMRRHMTRIFEINAAEGWVEVEPGVVLDVLNAELAPTGLFFAPTTSTASRCTIGGMVSTDASGKGSRVYGKTSDNVLGLRLALEGGQILASDGDVPDWAKDMLAEVAQACDAGRAQLLARVPALSRRFTGYDLERARPNGDELQWWRLIFGAEGTLGVVTRVRLRLVPRPSHRLLAVLAFDNFTSALDAGQSLLACSPLAIETIDEVVQKLAEDAGLFEGLPENLRGRDGLRPVYNFVEFVGNDAEEVEKQVQHLATLLEGLDGLVGYHFAREEDEIAHLWSVRASSVGLLGHSNAKRRPIPFVEDCVVPPENLAAFVQEFVQILKEHGLAYGMFGHIDVGCLHVRPALDIDQSEDRVALKTISDAVYELVKRHGGIFWGEHGKGIRGQYLPDFVGPEAYAAFQRIKAAFDPAGRFNPGKLVAPENQLRTIDHTPMRRFNGTDGDLFAKAFECNGNAACLTSARTVQMCPSYKVTTDLRHSPKGRAEILQAWRETGGANPEIEASAFAALDGCLGCNACSSRCPTHVNIPEMKSRFLSDYFTRHRRPLADRAAIALEVWSGALSKARPALRLADRFGISRAIGSALGMVDLPSFPLSARLERFKIDERNIENISADSRSVFVLQDPFTSLFDVDAVEAVCHGLQLLGNKPILLTLRPAGKAAHVLGDRRTFKKLADKLSRMLRRVAKTGYPIVGVDPAQTLMIRQEYPGNGYLDLPEVLLVQEFLLQRLHAGDIWPGALPQTGAKLFLHCTEASANPDAGKQWQQIMDGLGLEVEIASTGCCGMAGVYGHQARHQEISKQLFELSWTEQIDQDTTVYASGFSCRCQTERMAKTIAHHPMELVRRALLERSGNAQNAR